MKLTLPQAWRELLAQAENGTLSACNDTVPCNETLSAFDVQSVLANSLQNQPDFLMLLEGLAAALGGDGAALVSSSPLTIDQVWAFVLVCADNGEHGHCRRVD